jgi:hypothetical protein
MKIAVIWVLFALLVEAANIFKKAVNIYNKTRLKNSEDS